MGRTNPTFRAYLDRFVDEWQPYRRGLRVEHQAAFDALLAEAEGFAAAAGNRNATDPDRAILLSMVLAHQLRLDALEAAIEADVASAAPSAMGGEHGADGEPASDG